MTILIFIAVLVVLIVVHELGHFAAAKWLGIKVDEFGVGFPPRLWSRRWRGTEYSVNALPFGGFVKLAGEYGEEAGPGTFAAAPVWKRVIVVVAGVVMNALLAILLLFGGYLRGFTPLTQDVTSYPGAQVIRAEVIIARVLAGSVADQSGIKPGDIILTAKDTTPFSSLQSFQDYTRSRGGQAVEFSVKRDGQTLTVPATLGTDARAPFGVEIVSNSLVKLPVAGAARAAVTEFWGVTKSVGSALGSFLKGIVTTGKVAEDVAGPVGIYQATAAATRAGTEVLLALVVLLSVNLAVLNILPIPALDGGRLVFLILEGTVRRKVVREEIEGFITTAGFVALIGLIIVLTVRDLIRL